MNMKLFSISNYTMFALFILSLVVQYNDPDSLQWMAIYGAASLACIAYGRYRFDLLFSIVVGIIAIVWAGLLIPLVEEFSFSDVFESVQMKNMSVEFVREISGLLIVIFWMAVLSIKSYKAKV